MYRLYWCAGTAAFGPQAVLEEAALDYEIVAIDIGAGENRRPEFLAINPIGKLPALILPTGEILYEAAAIMLYLADHHDLRDLAPDVHDPDRGLFLRSLFYLSNTVQDAYKRYYYPERNSTDPADADRIKARAVENLIAFWKPVDDHLAAHGPYLLGDRFSLTDIYLVMLATWFETPDDLFRRYSNVGRCFDLTARRPGVRRCLEAQKSISVGAGTP